MKIRLVIQMFMQTLQPGFEKVFVNLIPMNKKRIRDYF